MDDQSGDWSNEIGVNRNNNDDLTIAKGVNMASKRGLRIRAAKIAAREKELEKMVIVLRRKELDDTEPFCKCEQDSCLCSDGGCTVCDTKIKVGEFVYSNYHDSVEVRRQSAAAMIPSHDRYGSEFEVFVLYYEEFDDGAGMKYCEAILVCKTCGSTYLQDEETPYAGSRKSCQEISSEEAEGFLRGKHKVEQDKIRGREQKNRLFEMRINSVFR